MNHPFVEPKKCGRSSIWWALLIAALMALGTACDGSREAETTLFESAEVDYRAGNYDEAMSGYHAFLKRYPQSPLAPTVEMRLRSINREVSTVMESTGSPRPSYHGSHTEQSQPESGIEPSDEPGEN